MGKIFKLLSILLIICCFSSVVSCKPTIESNKFTGVVSQNSYSSIEEALSAFLEEEFSSNLVGRYNYSSYEKTGTLTQTEINWLDIKKESGSQIKGEKGIVVFTCENSETMYETEVYLLNEDGNYRYCTVEPWDDIPLSKSYYNFIVQKEKYENVTVKIDTTTLLNRDGFKTTTNINLDLYCTEEYVYVSFDKQVYSGAVSDIEFVELWIINTESGIKVYTVGENSEYVQVTDDILPVLNDTLDNITPIATFKNYKHTAFMYKDNTFYLKEEVKEEYKNKFLQELFGNTDGEVFAINTDVEIERDRISVVTETANAKSGENTISHVMTATYTEYGKTVVQIPGEILQLAKE